MTRWLVLVALVASGCRGKENGGAPVGSGAKPTGAANDRWSAVIRVGKGSGVLSVGSGPIGTFVVSTRHDGSSITVNGKELFAASADEGEAYVQLDAKGAPIWGGVLNGTGHPPALSVGSSDAVANLAMVSIAAKGAIATLPSKAMTPVDGNVQALARTASGTIWIAGRNWGSDDPLAEGTCDGDAFLARRTPGGVEVVDCDSGWANMHLAAIGEDVVMCGSDGNKIGGQPIDGQTFLARIGSDAKLKWLRYINEVGDARCTDVVITSDGDIVATGTANKNVDLTEGAKANGVMVKSSAGLGLDRLWLVRYDQAGTRRWARVIAESTVGFMADLDADRDSNALLVSSIATPLDLGHGPIGPKAGATIVATIDRDANVTGLLTTDFTNAEQGVVDAQNGVVLAFSTSDPVSVAGVAFSPPESGVEYVGVVRFPLPLPKP